MTRSFQLRHVERIIGRNIQHQLINTNNTNLFYTLHLNESTNHLPSPDTSLYCSETLEGTLNPTWESITLSTVEPQSNEQSNEQIIKAFKTSTSFIIRVWQRHLSSHAIQQEQSSHLLTVPTTEPIVSSSIVDDHSSSSSTQKDGPSLILESTIDISSLVQIHSTHLQTLPNCPANSLIIVLADGLYVDQQAAQFFSVYRPSRSSKELSTARAFETDCDECLINSTVLLNLQQQVVGTSRDLQSTYQSLQTELETRLKAQQYAQKVSDRRKRLHELQNIVALEEEVVRVQRIRVQQQRHVMLDNVHALQARMSAVTNLQRSFNQIQTVISDGTELLKSLDSAVELRQRKLVYQLSQLFPIVPVHSKRERENDRAKRKKRGASRSQSPSRHSTNSRITRDAPPSPSVMPFNSAVSLSLTSHVPPARFYRIGDAVLPPFTALLHHSDEQVSSALGLVTLVVSLIAKYMNIPSRYRLCFRGSRSTLIDECDESAPVFPLYSRHVDAAKFEYAVYFLNQNIEYLLNESVRHWQVNVQVNANTGEKLKILFEGLIGVL